MLTVQLLSYTLPQGRILFRRLNFTLGPKKYGLVGANGVGKSTLVRILAGELTPSEGSVLSQTRPYYMSQFEDRPKVSAGEYLLDIWESPNLNPQMQNQLLGGFDLSVSLGSLSGGEWMRIRLLKAAALSTGLLILDEPTNDLDRAGREMLYKFVRNFRGGLLVISHDRELLEEVEGIWELSNQGLCFYGGRFSFYEEAKRAERERLEGELDVARRDKKKQERAHQEKIDRQEKRQNWAKNNIENMGLPKILVGARKRQAQVTMGRIRTEEQKRDQAAAATLRELHQKQKATADLRVQISTPLKMKGKALCRAENLNVAYEVGRPLWKEPLNFFLAAQERLWIQGGNGAGKSTLLRLLTGAALPGSLVVEGRYEPIRKEFVYLDQGYGGLNTENSVLEAVRGASLRDEGETRNLLADYGFYGGDVFKKVRHLSGGERVRLTLAKLLISERPVEVLVLDEPTNNLDLESLGFLERALGNYKGALLVVSHDQTFIKKLSCGQVVELRQHKDVVSHSGCFPSN